MADFDPMFAQLLQNAGVPKGFDDFLRKQNIVSAEAFGLLASAESDVNKEILEPAAAEVKFGALGDKVAVKKLWAACRKNMKTAESMENLAGNAEVKMPKETEDDIKSLWLATHGFILPDAMLLTSNLQGRIWRDLSASPPESGGNACGKLASFIMRESTVGDSAITGSWQSHRGANS